LVPRTHGQHSKIVSKWVKLRVLLENIADHEQSRYSRYNNRKYNLCILTLGQQEMICLLYLLLAVPGWNGQALLLGGSTYGATLPATRAVTCRGTLSPGNCPISDSRRALSLGGSTSSATGRFDIGGNSTSGLPSDFLTGKLTCRATLPSVTLSATRAGLCHWATWHGEQILLTERALSLGGST
jgi:hypothetical protein